MFCTVAEHQVENKDTVNSWYVTERCQRRNERLFISASIVYFKFCASLVNLSLFSFLLFLPHLSSGTRFLPSLLLTYRLLFLTSDLCWYSFASIIMLLHLDELFEGVQPPATRQLAILICVMVGIAAGCSIAICMVGYYEEFDTAANKSGRPGDIELTTLPTNPPRPPPQPGVRVPPIRGMNPSRTPADNTAGPSRNADNRPYPRSSLGEGFDSNTLQAPNPAYLRPPRNTRGAAPRRAEEPAGRGPATQVARKVSFADTQTGGSAHQSQRSGPSRSEREGDRTPLTN